MAFHASLYIFFSHSVLLALFTLGKMRGGGVTGFQWVALLFVYVFALLCLRIKLEKYRPN